MLSLPQKAMAGLASALLIGALAPATANASLFRFSVSGEFDSFGAFPVDDFTSVLGGGSFLGEIVVDGLPVSDGSRLISWEIDLFQRDRFPFPYSTFSSVLPDAGGQNDLSFTTRSVFGGSQFFDSLYVGEGTLGGSEREIEFLFPKGFVGSGPLLFGSALRSYDNNRFIDGVFIPIQPTGVIRIISGSATLISGPTFSDIDFTFDETVATLESPPTLVEREAGLSVEDLSYSLEALTDDLQEFSWNATRDISVAWTEPSLSSIFGSTTIGLDGAASELEFFVQGLLNDDPFDMFTKRLTLADGASQLVQWDLAQIVDLLPGDYTLALTSGVRWQPSAPDSVLTVSSQYGAEVAPIPTPALLPGLVGMGVAALRRRRKGEAA